LNCSLSSPTGCCSDKVELVLAPRPAPPACRCYGRKRRFRKLLDCTYGDPGGASARYGESRYVFRLGARIGRRTGLTLVWANRHGPSAPKDLGFRFGLFVWCGLPVGGQAAALIMADLQTRHEPHLSEIISLVAADAHAWDPLLGCQLAHSRDWGAQQYHFVIAACLTARSSSGRVGFGTTAQPCSPLVISYLRTSWTPARWLEPVRHQPGLSRSLCAVAWAPASSAL